MVAHSLAPSEEIADGSPDRRPPDVEAAPAHRDEPRTETLIPALLRPYRDLETIRHDYPVVLLDEGAEMAMAPLADLLDDLLRRIDPGTRDVEGLRRHLYRLEKLIKRGAEAEPGVRLSSLWNAAASSVVAVVTDDERRSALAQELEAAREALGRDGAVLPCRPDAVRPIVEHAWRRLRAEQAMADAAVLADLSGRISDLIDAERAQSPEAVAPEALRASMAGEHSGVDFDALSRLLSRGGQRHRPSRRARRLREPLRVVEAERERLLREADALRREVSGVAGGASTSLSAASSTWHREGVREARVLRALRLAALELGNRYRRERHDALFADQQPGELSPEERRAAPAVLVSLDADELTSGDYTELLAVLSSDVPLKIILAVHRLPGEASSGPARGRRELDIATRIAEMALVIGEAFVVQAVASQLPRMASAIAGALRHEGPALVAVYVGPAETKDRASQDPVPTYVRCAAAVESRAFPTFVCDPARGPEWFTRFSLADNPQAEDPWPYHLLSYEGADGGTVEEEVPFTIADLLALDPSFRSHFELVPQVAWHPRMAPVAEALADEPGRAAAMLPYVYVVDADDRLYRALVSPELVAIARASAANWARLQALARAGAPVATPATTISEVAPTLEAAAVAPPEPAPAAPPAEQTATAATGAPAPGAAYIESALCTTCDECTGRNPQMFAYNAQKQAFIQDLRAGTYRELVEAAENCPVCIIHPGQPLDPNEPGLDDLVKRAASFA